jgi:glycosyltransferase involved in cell wall biosynthesis
MRISVIALGRRGAGGPFSLELARHLKAYAEVNALLAQGSESILAWAAAGIDYHLVSTYQTISQALLTYLQKGRFRAIAEIIKQQKPDVLLFPLFYTWNPFIQAHLSGIPSVVAVHDPIPHPGFSESVYKFLEDKSIQRASRCLLLSESLRQALVQRGAVPEKIDHIPHGVLSAYYQGLPAQPTQTPDRLITLLFFGRITPYKGLEVLLQAYQKIKSRHDLRLLIVGSGDMKPYQSLLKDLPEVEVVNEWIREEDIDQYFCQADILVLPYTSASQSGVLAVAAGYALPVLATRVGGIPEQIIDGETGLLVEPNSVDHLAQRWRSSSNSRHYLNTLEITCKKITRKIGIGLK